MIMKFEFDDAELTKLVDIILDRLDHRWSDGYAIPENFKKLVKDQLDVFYKFKIPKEFKDN